MFLNTPTFLDWNLMSHQIQMIILKLQILWISVCKCYRNVSQNISTVSHKHFFCFCQVFVKDVEWMDWRCKKIEVKRFHRLEETLKKRQSFLLPNGLGFYDWILSVFLIFFAEDTLFVTVVIQNKWFYWQREGIIVSSALYSLVNNFFRLLSLTRYILSLSRFRFFE